MLSSLGDYLFMEGHGVYVWPAWGVALGVLAALAVASLRRLRRLRRELAALEGSSS